MKLWIYILLSPNLYVIKFLGNQKAEVVRAEVRGHEVNAELHIQLGMSDQFV